MGLDRRKALTDGYSEHLDGFLSDVDKSEQLFRDANAVAENIVGDMGEEYSKRVAKMRDFKERVEAAFPAPD